MNAEVSVVEARAALGKGAVLIDVRECDEWAEEHVAGAVLVPLESVPERLDEIPRAGDVILMCRSGRRSGLAQETLEVEHGYGNVANMTGGILAWKEAGFPVVSGS